MGTFAETVRNGLLNHCLGGPDYSRLATVYVGLKVGASEVSGGSYARVAVTNNATNWPAAASGSKSNGTVVSFVTPTGDWGTVDGFFISDAASAGNEIGGGLLTQSQVIQSGNPVSFPIGSLVASIT